MNGSRRGFLLSCLALGVAPAIVRASSLMTIYGADPAFAPEGYEWLDGVLVPNTNIVSFEELTELTRRVWIPKLVKQIYNTSPLMSQLIANANLELPTYVKFTWPSA